MSSEAEQRPHIVFSGDGSFVSLHPDYQTAFAVWQSHYASLAKFPLKIAVVGRECTPAAEVIDCNA